MNIFKYLIIFLFLFGYTDVLSLSCTKITVCFTPGGNCTDQIIHVINKSRKSILIQAFEFTSRPIARSLIRAKERGVDVRVILDESQIASKYSVINELFKQNIAIWIDYKPAIAHSKIIIIDNRKVITGSFNFTHSAQERNAENLLIIENNLSLVKKYVKNWKNRQSQSLPYRPNSPTT